MKANSLTTTEVNQNFSRAKKALSRGPVLITEHGKPSMVLLRYDDYVHRGWMGSDILAALDVHGVETVDIDFAKLDNTPFQPRDLD
jgi:PHD/YefM family antitoxin component YafN of YafNO toxin-antitoxin module